MIQSCGIQGYRNLSGPMWQVTAPPSSANPEGTSNDDATARNFTDFRVPATCSASSPLSAVVFKEVITDDRQNRHRTPHLARRNYRSFRQCSIIGAALAAG